MKFMYLFLFFFILIEICFANKNLRETVSNLSDISDWNKLIQSYMTRNNELPIKDVESGIEEIMDKFLRENERKFITNNSNNSSDSKKKKSPNLNANYYNERFYKDYYDPVFSKVKPLKNHKKIIKNVEPKPLRKVNISETRIVHNPIVSRSISVKNSVENSKDKYSNSQVSLPKIIKRKKIPKKKTKSKTSKKEPNIKIEKQPRTIESSVTYPSGLKVDVIRNYNLPIKIRFTKKLSTFVKCQQKTGFLNYLENTKNLHNGYVSTFPIYLKLTKKFLGLFSSITEKSLIFSINLDSIQRIDQSLKGTFCFDIILNDVLNIKILQTSKVSLCAYNQKEMQDWILAILQFKECSIATKSTDHNGKVLLDFTKINDLEKSKELSNEHSLNNVYYDSTDKAFKHEINKESLFKHEMKDIKDILKLGKIARLQLKRRLRGKLNKSRIATSMMLRKEGLVKSIIEKKMNMIKKTEQTLIKSENKKRKRMLIESLKKKIQRLKAKELRDYQMSYETEIKFEREKSMKEAQSMMKLLLNQQRLENYAVCLSEKLFKFNNRQYVEKFCYKHYGEHGKNTCAYRIHFCDFCCESKIGIGFLQRRASCKTNCNLLVTGEVKNLKGEVMKLNKEFSKKYEKELEELMKGKMDSRDQMKKMTKLLKKKMKASKNFKKMIINDLKNQTCNKKL